VPLHQWNLLRHLPGLKRIEITDCSDMSCGSTDFRQYISLDSLTVKHGENGTVTLPERLGYTSLAVFFCKGIKTLQLPESLQQLTCLRHLEITSCPKLVALPERLGDLTSLVNFWLYDCKGIKSLPESIQQLTCLQCLQISYCPELVQWCISEENRIKLAHIKDTVRCPANLSMTIFFICICYSVFATFTHIPSILNYIPYWFF